MDTLCKKFFKFDLYVGRLILGTHLVIQFHDIQETIMTDKRFFGRDDHSDDFWKSQQICWNKKAAWAFGKKDIAYFNDEFRPLQMKFLLHLQSLS